MSKTDVGESAKNDISRAEYLQLMGLRAVADKYNALLKAIEVAAYEITAELDRNGKPETMGHTSDFIYGNWDLDTMLERLGLKVVDPPVPPTEAARQEVA